MQLHKGRVAAAAAGILCAIAATVGVWSGPLAAASGTLHSGAPMTASTTSPAHASTNGSR
jgi:hypothetical protein